MQLLSQLVSEGTEYFTASKQRHEVKSGEIRILDEFPEDFYKLLSDALKADQSACKALDKLAIFDKRERVEKYFDCNYSAFGGDADVTHAGILGDKEVVKCEIRNVCQFEGKLCHLPCNLTKREAQVARAVAEGKMDAQITAELFISQNTLRNHKNNIEHKIGQSGKIAIAVWTKTVGLL